MAPRTQSGQEAVTPVIGTLLVLAITVIGMAGIMIWGAPTIEAVQAQNAQVAVIGEFEELRSSSIDLSIPDASRIPTINVARGTLSVEQGSRMMVTANHDAAACDLHVTGWADSTVNTVSYNGAGCTLDTFEVLQVVGSNTVRRHSQAAAGGTVAVTIPATASFTPDVSEGDWLFRLTNGDDLALVVYAQAWLVDSDQIAWRLDTTTGGIGAYFDLGAVFSSNGPASFVEKPPSLQENEFASGVYSLRLRTMSDTGGIGAISGRGSHQVFLGLVGNHVRVDEPAYRLRIDVAGPLAESWCNLFVLRNEALDMVAYTEDATMPCEQASDSAVRSVVYVPLDPVTAVPDVPFDLEVLHANVRITLSA